MNLQKFVVDVPDSTLADLRTRLDRTRLPAAIDGAGWSYGTDMDYLHELIEYWKTEFDWRAAETRLNALPQYHEEIAGIDLHFVYRPGVGPNPMPLLFVHGWPGSFWEVSKILGPLTDPASYGGDPADAFSVVAPSLPGFGFSSDTHHPGLHPGMMADVLTNLMSNVLGFRHFLGQGGDWGSTVLTRIAYARPERLIGLHLNYASTQPSLNGAPPLTPAEEAYLEATKAWNAQEGAYNALLSTKPQSIGAALNDSPAGLASWLIDKYRAWSDSSGDVERAFSKDELLTQTMIYWVTQSIASSSRLYAERLREGWQPPLGDVPNVPTAYARFAAEFRQPPREWLERIYQLERFTEMPRGGHFAALEAPDLLVDDIRAFARQLRAHSKSSNSR